MKSILKQYGGAVVSGVVLALSFPTWHLYPLAWVALVPLLYRTRQCGPRESFAQFFLAGAAFHLVLLQWLLTNVYWGGGWAIWGYFLLVLIMAAYWGLTGLCLTWLRARLPGIPAALILAVLWPAMEYLQGTLFTGFCWGSLAYSQGRDLPLLQWAALGGAPLVSAIIVAVNALLAQVLSERPHRIRRVAAAAGILAVSHGVGLALIAEPDFDGRPFTAGVLQSDFPLEMKWDPEYTVEMVRNAVRKSTMLVREAPVDLVVWPESLIMSDITNPQVLDAVTRFTRDTRCALFTGTGRTDEDSGEARNSSVLIDAEGKVLEHYDKIHLAPFGEYVPLSRLIPFVGKIIPAIGDMHPGSEPRVYAVGERRFGPLICFETLFAPMADRLRQDGADFLIVITNLGWFGASNAIPQELEIARVRAVETRLALVHAANTGISGVFDPWGRFQGVDLYFPTADRFVSIGHIPIHETIMYRCAGALPVAAPGPRPIPGGPRVFPLLALLSSVVMLVAATLRGRKGSDLAGGARGL
jgi:apolipoprotein N-acyltransferase